MTTTTKTTRRIRIYRLAPGTTKPAEVMVPYTLQAMQAQVGGDLEAIPTDLTQHEIMVLVDEEGGPALKALPVTLRTPDGLVLRGPVLFVRQAQDGSWANLTEAQRTHVLAWLKRCWTYGKR